MNIQQMLASDPSLGFNVAPTGFFGPLTKRAMERYQEMNGIASSTTGYVGPLTRGFFERHCGEGLGNPGSASSSVSEEMNSTMQLSGSSTKPSINMNGLMGGEDHGNGNGHANNGNGHGDN